MVVRSILNGFSLLGIVSKQQLGIWISYHCTAKQKISQSKSSQQALSQQCAAPNFQMRGKYPLRLSASKHTTVIHLCYLYLTGYCFEFYRPTPSTNSTKPHRMPPKTSQKPPKSSRHATTSINQLPFISLKTKPRIGLWITLYTQYFEIKVELASLPDERKCKTLPR